MFARFILLLSALLLGACSSNPQQLYLEQVVASQTPLAETPADALRNATAIPIPINPGWRPPQWQITAAEPRIKLDGKIANYRVFSVDLKKTEPYTIDVNSWCVNSCLGFSKYALNPRLLLLDAKGNVVAEKLSQASGYVGSISQTIRGTVIEDGRYYLLVAADNRAPGATIVMDRLLMVGGASPATPMDIGMGSYPFGHIGPYLSRPED